MQCFSPIPRYGVPQIRLRVSKHAYHRMPHLSASRDDPSNENNAGRRALEDLLGDDFDTSQLGNGADGDLAREGFVPEDVLREVDENRPSTFRVMSDVMGVNLFTYVLAALIVLFSGANFLLGDGWLSTAMNGGEAPAPIRKERVLDLPEGYAEQRPSTEELLKNIPKDDLERIGRGENPLPQN